MRREDLPVTSDFTSYVTSLRLDVLSRKMFLIFQCIVVILGFLLLQYNSYEKN